MASGHLASDQALHAVGHAGAGHAAEGLHAHRHVVDLVLDEVDELADLHVALAAAHVVVVVLAGELGDVVHVGQVVAVQPQHVGVELEYMPRTA